MTESMVKPQAKLQTLLDTNGCNMRSFCVTIVLITLCPLIVSGAQQVHDLLTTGQMRSEPAVIQP
jgi:hypothetical protein